MQHMCLLMLLPKWEPADQHAAFVTLMTTVPRTWIEVRQQAAEEDLEMPVVLEEFGCKLDARPDQYKLAYDSCLTSAKRGGSCAGVMFWDLAHKVP